MAYHLGIDLGTTYTAAAVHADGRTEMVSLGERTPSIPSVLYLRPDGGLLAGDAANRAAITDPERVAREFKRRLGDPTPLMLGGSPTPAEVLSGHLLRWVYESVVRVRGGPPASVALSHPANWGSYKLDLYARAAEMAGVRQVAMVTEPEAAAISYASQERVEPGAVVAVYDLGGGTFDAAVLRKEPSGRFTVLGTPEGIERLGGIDFDAAVFAHVGAALGGALDELDPDDATAVSAVARLRQECTQAKEALSLDTEATIPVLLPNIQTEVRISRQEFEEMIRPTLAETVTALGRALRSTGLNSADVRHALLVGGSSRIPLVSQLVSACLGRPVAIDAHPKHAIALGAALVAAGATSAPAAGPGGPPAAAAAVPVGAAAAAIGAGLAAGPAGAVPGTGQATVSGAGGSPGATVASNGALRPPPPTSTTRLTGLPAPTASAEPPPAHAAPPPPDPQRPPRPDAVPPGGPPPPGAPSPYGPPAQAPPPQHPSPFGPAPGTRTPGGVPGEPAPPGYPPGPPGPGPGAPGHPPSQAAAPGYPPAPPGYPPGTADLAPGGRPQAFDPTFDAAPGEAPAPSLGYRAAGSPPAPGQSSELPPGYLSGDQKRKVSRRRRRRGLLMKSVSVAVLLVAIAVTAVLLLQQNQPKTLDDIEVGDCFNGEVDDLEPVDCGQPHDAELFAVVQATNPDGGFPGVDALELEAGNLCTLELVGYFGAGVEVALEAGIELDPVTPSEAQWNDGVTDSFCLAISSDGDQLQGSVEGAGAASG